MGKRKSFDYLDCTVANSAEIIGDRWSLVILRDAFLGVRRFDDFAKDLGIARNILSSRLEKLIGSGIMETRQYQDNPPRVEYRLTEKGKDLFDILLALWRWGDRWEPPDQGPTRRLIHRTCGKTTHSIAACAECGEGLERSAVRIEPGVALIEERIRVSGQADA